ncbi:MAG: DUF2252 domain-containing protein [Thermoplasmata archaeon]|jgi:uncharacterized protein (DUF2252 family)
MANSTASLNAAADSRTRSARLEAGKALRRRFPRSVHAVWSPPKDRPDPIDLMGASDRGRVPGLLPIRYGRMSLSPFTFLRGAAGVMAHDLSSTPTTGLRVQLCGDAHLSNFGIFGTPERELVFDVNDFDETIPGPWEWDVKRLVTSFVVAGRVNGYSRSDTRKAARTAARAYREMMSMFATMRYSDIWYYHLNLEGGPLPVGRDPRRLLRGALRQARRRTSLQAFPKMVKAVGGRYLIRNNLPLIVHYKDPAAAEVSRSFYDRYLATLPDERRMLLDRYHIVDVAQKVVGVGSVGTACSVLLLMGDRDVEDPLFLQLKQATASALEPYVGASVFPNHAQRVVVGQHLVQEASDIFLGWGRLRSRDFYVRQLRDMKFANDISALGPREFAGQAKLCGTALARGHARAGDPARISGYLGNGDPFDRAVTAFAEAYADQTVRDYQALVRAIKRGRIAAEIDV